MELNPRPSKARVPIGLRQFAYRIGGYSPFEQCFRAFYSSTERRVAKRLLEVPSVSAVALRGSAVDRCAPVLSDLDFILSLREPLTVSQVLELRRRYRGITRRLFLPGEVLAVVPRLAALFDRYLPALGMACEPRRIYRLGKIEVVGRESSFSSVSRFGFGLYQMAKGVSSLLSSKHSQTSGFMQARAFRDLEKMFQSTATLLPQKRSLAVWLAAATRSLDALAKEGGLRVTPLVSPLDLKIEGEWEVPLWIEHERASQFTTRFPQFEVDPTPFTGSVVLDDGVDLESFWTAWLESCFETALPIRMVLTRAMFQRQLEGWWHWEADFNWILMANRETYGIDILQDRDFQSVIFASTFHRVLMRLGVLAGLWFYESFEVCRNYAKRLCREYQVIYKRGRLDSPIPTGVESRTQKLCPEMEIEWQLRVFNEVLSTLLHDLPRFENVPTLMKKGDAK